MPEPADVAADVEAAATLPGLPSPGRLRQLAEDYRRGQAEQRRSLVVALVGATGAGKSTLLNALAGTALSEEGTSRPTSRQAVVYAPEDAAVGPLSATGARIVRYREHPAALWAGQVFVDTPDLNSVEQENREVARAVLERADVALVVLHRGSVAEAVQADFLREFARRRQLMFVVNFADELGPESRTTLKDQVRRIAHEELGQPPAEVSVHALSARAAKAGEDPSGELGLFLAALRALAERATRERILRSNAVGALRELASLAGEGLRAHDAVSAELGEALRAGFEEGGRQVREAFASRLETARAHLRAEARKEAASRWWGPAAWWMRLSFLGGGGMGAAALLARVNPLTGAAVAAGSAALSLLQQKTLAGAADRRMAELALPGDGALTPAAQRLLGGARALVVRRGWSPEAAALPAEEALRVAVGQSVQGAWEHARGPGLAQAVERWWRWARWLLVPLINLPLLALLGHVAYQVVRAYLVGPYLPLHYYANALALGLVLAMGGALLASSSLAGVARRAARAGEEALERELGALASTLQAQVEGAALPAKQAAARLLAHAAAL